MRYRTNIDCLSADELHALREALSGMYALPAADRHSFAKVASLHGGPPTAYCRHGAPGFFTWHRAYLMAFEDALRSVSCDVTVPYWDWSSGPSVGVAEACRYPTSVNRSGITVPNPLYSGPLSGGGQTTRRANIDSTSFADLAAQAQAAMSATTFESFQQQIDGVHGGVHGRVGGEMSWVATAAYDPIFYLHHANVDRLWAEWQAGHPGSLPASEATSELAPFNRPFSSEWQRGSDVESTQTLGYRYRRFCLVLPLIRLWEAFTIDWPSTVKDRMTSARLALRTQQVQPQPVEIRAFVDQPGATERTDPVPESGFAGAVGFLGHRTVEATKDCLICGERGHAADHSHHHDHQTHRHPGGTHGDGAVDGERFDVELNLTAALRARDSSSNKVVLKLVAVDPDGKQVDPDDVLLDEIELVVE